MSAEAILDAVAVKAATVTGIRKAYGSGAGSSAVATLPSDVADGPVALVLYDGSEMEIPGGYERIAHRFVVRVYVNGADTGYAYKTLLPFVSRFVAAWRTDSDLGATCQFSQLMGADQLDAEEVNGKPYLVLPVRVTAWEVTAATYTV